MKCVKCSGEDVTVGFMQAGGRTAKHGTGFGGKTNNAARGITAVSTFGMSNLVWKKSKGTEKTKFNNQKVALCQSCGHDWVVR
ncbi:hypothetical protein ACFFOS_26080 [Nocardioides kongjuensis]|uniref:Uncharacterized protein n=1 Tax=Nocardioides kongjuensis TaxID=349522 RepID=A0A852RKV4_9ACTN|nr:hypothetical protein [Nocardioides kongjuensis]NYD31239.1 hypothetical protein [Nocardioides kongjuensis]